MQTEDTLKNTSPFSGTPIKSIGLTAINQRIADAFKSSSASTLLGGFVVRNGEAIAFQTNKSSAFAQHMLIEGIDFNLGYFPLKHLGYKAVVIAISKLYAMGAVPRGLSLSLAVSNRFTFEALDDLYWGMAEACRFYGLELMQNHIGSSLRGMVLSVTALGVLEQELSNDKTAQPNDLIVVTGDLGTAYLGLQVLERENQVYKVNPNMQPELDNYTYLIERQLKPEACHWLDPLLKRLNIIPSSMRLVSNGLSNTVLALCKDSNIGADLYEVKLPIDPQTMLTADEFGLHPTTVALNGGEDYVLLFTVSTKYFDVLNKVNELTIIGHITDETLGATLVTQAGERIKLKALGDVVD